MLAQIYKQDQNNALELVRERRIYRPSTTSKLFLIRSVKQSCKKAKSGRRGKDNPVMSRNLQRTSGHIRRISSHLRKSSANFGYMRRVRLVMHPVHDTILQRTMKKCIKTLNPRTELLLCSLNPLDCGVSVSAENRGFQTSQISQEGDMAVCGRYCSFGLFFSVTSM